MKLKRSLVKNQLFSLSPFSPIRGCFPPHPIIRMITIPDIICIPRSNAALESRSPMVTAFPLQQVCTVRLQSGWSGGRSQRAGQLTPGHLAPGFLPQPLTTLSRADRERNTIPSSTRSVLSHIRPIRPHIPSLTSCISNRFIR